MYFRTEEKVNSQTLVRDFYLSGQLQMEGKFSSMEPEIRNGYFTWYYESGQKYVEGNYLQGKRDGIWTFWYPDGVKKEELDFSAAHDFYTVKWESKRLKASRQLLQKAQKKKNRGKIEDAIALLNTGIQIYPYSADLYFERSMIFCAMENFGACCDDLVKARELGFYNTIALNGQLEFFCPQKLKTETY